MTQTFRWLSICLGLAIAGALVWQFIQYNNSLDHPVDTKAVNGHYFWYRTHVGEATPEGPKASGPHVVQKYFTVDMGKPDPSSFTCHVTLKNIGNAKAIGVQINVRPFRDAIISGGEIAPVNQPGIQTVNDNDFLGQISQWVNFPDIAPGQSVVKDVVFPRRSEVDPGNNPSPDISYSAEKSKP